MFDTPNTAESSTVEKSPKPPASRHVFKPTPLRAIRQKCIACMGGSPKDVAECVSVDCELFRYRFGKNPSRAARSEKQVLSALKNLSPKASGGECE